MSDAEAAMKKLEKHVANPPAFCPSCQKIFDKYWRDMAPFSEELFRATIESSDRTYNMLVKMAEEGSND